MSIINSLRDTAFSHIYVSKTTQHFLISYSFITAYPTLARITCLFNTASSKIYWYEGILISFASKSITLEKMKTNK